MKVRLEATVFWRSRLQVRDHHEAWACHAGELCRELAPARAAAALEGRYVAPTPAELMARAGG